MRLVLPLALAAGLLAPVPALAQESPSPAGCPTVFYSVSQEQQSGPAGEPVTLTFASDVGPSRTPDRWTLSRVSPAPEVVLQTAPSGPSATFTVTASETTTYRVTSETAGCTPASATFTRTVTTSSPTPCPVAECGYSDPSCPVVDADVLTPFPITSGQDVLVRAVVSAAPATSTVTLFRDSPAPRATVRSQAAEDGVALFRVRLGETHTLVASVASTGSCLGGRQATVVVPVHAAVSLAAVRTAPRRYAFSGRVQPAYGTVSLYRVEDTGHRVLTARTAVQRDGTYRIDRRFTGSGRFGFVAVADPGSTGRYSAGESRVRPTVVH